MIRRNNKLFIGGILLFLCLTSTCVAQNVKPIDWSRFDRKPLNSESAMELRMAISNANRYILNKSWYEVKGFDQKSPYIDFGGRLENDIRPASHQAFSLALSMKLNILDTTFVHHSTAQVIEKCRRLIESLAYRHKANGGNWGDHWQSALWASLSGTAAWVVWDDLSVKGQEMVSRMIKHEANRFLDNKVPYYKDLNGKVIYKGDSKAEENAWNSNILHLAHLMFPDDVNAPLWKKRSYIYQLSAYATPSDALSRKKINGMIPSEILEGSNMEEDGRVINHHIMHPDYMSAIMHNFLNGWISCLAGEKVPSVSIHNLDLVHDCFVNHDFDGKTIYTTEEGKASANLHFPDGNDWGNYRQANYWLVDIAMHCFKLDKKHPIRAKDWADVRLKEMRRMQLRDTSGQYYQAKVEDCFFSREEWIAKHLVYGYLGLWLHEQGRDKVSKR